METQKSAVFFSSRPQLLLNQQFGFSFRSAGKVLLQSIESGHEVRKHWLHRSWWPSLCMPLSHHPSPKVRQERCMLLVSAQANSKQKENKMADCSLDSCAHTKTEFCVISPAFSQKTIASAVHHSCFTHYRCVCVFVSLCTFLHCPKHSQCHVRMHTGQNPLPHKLK